MEEELDKLAQDYLDQYAISDVINPESIFLFILESPHTQEMKYGYPVAGSSGREMTKFIYQSSNPKAFGKLVGQPKHDQEGLTKFSLLNVSPAPMQESGLQNYDLSTGDRRIVSILEKLRVNYDSQQHRNQAWNQLKEIILADFKERLVSTLQELDKLEYLIPCGKLAASYLDLIEDEIELIDNLEIIEGIPHPSFNQWSRFQSMEKLRDKLEQRL
ncbi:MAG: hypothetical protein ACQEQI_07705 [Bacillota bacterium]